jgi:hypothetical protein
MIVVVSFTTYGLVEFLVGRKNELMDVVVVDITGAKVKLAKEDRMEREKSIPDTTTKLPSILVVGLLRLLQTVPVAVVELDIIAVNGVVAVIVIHNNPPPFPFLSVSVKHGLILQASTVVVSPLLFLYVDY